MTIKKIALASLVALASSAAFAAGPGNLGTFDTIDIGNTFAEGTKGQDVADVFTFDLLSGGDLLGQVISTHGKQVGIANLTATLTGGSLVNPLVDNSANNGFEFLNLAAGTYSLTIGGKITGLKGGSYGGTLVAQAVPEPASVALLLAGLGVVGGVARRRSQA